jgi:hypothetical protein
MQTDGQTDMTKLILAFLNFAKAPKARDDRQIKNKLPENCLACFLRTFASALKKLSLLETVTGEPEIQKMSGNVCVADHDTGGLTGGRQSMKHAHTETKETERKSRATVMSGKK